MVESSEKLTQYEIEARLREPLKVELTDEVTFKEAFGDFEDWYLTIGEYRLWLNPLNRRWLFYDRIHDSLEDTGYYAGEVEFVVEGDELVPKELERPLVAKPASSDALLRIIEGPDTGEVFDVYPITLIGRERNCDIRLKDPAVSRGHALIVQHLGGFTIFDVGSENGTFVNDQEVSGTGTLLADGDRVLIGQTEFEFKVNVAAKVDVAQKTIKIPGPGISKAKCGVCNASVPDNAKFCPQCGSPLEVEKSAKCTSCGRELESGMKFCPGCGSPVK